MDKVPGKNRVTRTTGKKPRVREVRLEREVQEGPTRNTELGIITYLFIFLFLLLIGYLTYINVFKAKEYNASVYNTKQNYNEDKYIRGTILSSDGSVLAKTEVAEDGTMTRVYPWYNEFAHVIGYSTNGKAGLEASYNTELLTSSASLLSQLQEEDDQKLQGDTLHTTLDTRIQDAAYQALGEYNGAVVVMEADTGRILAMVSKPDYDPNMIGYLWEDLVNDDSSSVLLNRASQGLYPPGSTFKILTTLAYIRQEPGSYLDFLYQCTSSVQEEDVTISCYNYTVHGEETLKSAFAHSCNTAYATIGLELDPGEFRDMCEDFLFNRELPTSILHSSSVFELDDGASLGEEMTTAIGQGNTLVTPLHMAMITATVANDGVMMKPYLVDSITAYDGTTVSTNTPTKYKRLMTSEEARILREYMTETVTSGTAAALSWYGFSAAGKTGSAEYGVDGYTGTHSWFVGFSNPEDPDIVVAVIAEDGGTGSETAVPIAAQIFQAYYNE